MQKPVASEQGTAGGANNPRHQNQKEDKPKSIVPKRHIQRRGGGKTVLGVPSIGDRPETGRPGGLRVTVRRKGRWVRHGDLTLALFFLACESNSSVAHTAKSTTAPMCLIGIGNNTWMPSICIPSRMVNPNYLHRHPGLCHVGRQSDLNCQSTSNTSPHRTTSTYLRAPVESRSSAPLLRSGLLHLG